MQFLKSVPDYWCSKHRAKLKRDWVYKLRRKKKKKEDDAGTKSNVITCELKLLA